MSAYMNQPNKIMAGNSLLKVVIIINEQSLSITAIDLALEF